METIPHDRWKNPVRRLSTSDAEMQAALGVASASPSRALGVSPVGAWARTIRIVAGYCLRPFPAADVASGPELMLQVHLLN
jgi:hypothetical protein